MLTIHLNKYFFNEKEDDDLYNHSIQNSINVNYLQKLDENKYTLVHEFDLLYEENILNNIIVFDFEYFRIDFDEEFSKNLSKLIYESYKYVKEFDYLSEETNNFPYVNRVPIENLIYSIFHRAHDNKTSILNLSTDLFFGLARRHYFTNGNKRCAVRTVVMFLSKLGFFVKSSNKKNLLKKDDEWYKWAEILSKLESGDWENFDNNIELKNKLFSFFKTKLYISTFSNEDIILK